MAGNGLHGGKRLAIGVTSLVFVSELAVRCQPAARLKFLPPEASDGRGLSQGHADNGALYPAVGSALAANR